MTKELRAMLQKRDAMKQEVRTMIAEDNTIEAKTKMEEVRNLQAKIDLQLELEETESRAYNNGKELNDDGNIEERDVQELEKEYTGIVLRALRRHDVSFEQRSIIDEYERRAVMNEGGTNPAIPDGDSGLLVPKDIQTQINTLMRTFNDLSEYVNIQHVNTLSGSRVLEKDENMVPFANIDEYGEINPIDNPKFVKVSYKVQKRAGILPITNELLKDNDANLLGYVTQWIAKKAVFTRNTHIINLLKTLPKKTLANVAAINKELNVSLDPAISATSIILTNQDGYNWLDNQVDGKGRPLLMEDFTQQGRKIFKGRPIAIAANRMLPSEKNKAPLIIGNLKQLIILFTRHFFELASTKEGGDSFKRDTTDLRAIMRDDYVKWDEKAAVFGELDVTATPHKAQ